MADYTDVETVRKLRDMDPELAELLTSNPSAQPASLPTDIDPKLLRTKQLDDALTRANATRPANVREYTKEIRMRDGHTSQLRVVEPLPVPASPNGSPRPLIVLYFGGGFVMGNNMQLLPFAYAFATLCHAVVVLPTYRLAPEDPFPAGPNDSWDSFVWVAEHARELNADPSEGFVVGGVSAGANMAAVSVQRAVCEGVTPRVTGLWLSIPTVLSDLSVPESERHLYLSRVQCADSIGLNAEAIDRITKAYDADWLSPLSSPFNATDPHRGMPRTYFQVAGADPLRDDGLIYERTLRRNGVQTDMDVYPGVPHGHFGMFPMLRSSMKSNFDTAMGMGRLLGIELSKEAVIKALTPPKLPPAATA